MRFSRKIPKFCQCPGDTWDQLFKSCIGRRLLFWTSIPDKKCRVLCHLSFHPWPKNRNGNTSDWNVYTFNVLKHYFLEITCIFVNLVFNHHLVESTWLIVSDKYKRYGFCVTLISMSWITLIWVSVTVFVSRWFECPGSRWFECPLRFLCHADLSVR